MSPARSREVSPAPAPTAAPVIRCTLDIPEVYRGRFERAARGVEGDTGARVTFLGTNRESRLMTVSLAGQPEAVEDAKGRLQQVRTRGRTMHTLPDAVGAISRTLYLYTHLVA